MLEPDACTPKIMQCWEVSWAEGHDIDSGSTLKKKFILEERPREA